MPEQAGQLAQPQPPLGGALDQAKERPQFGLGGDEGGKARAQYQPPPADRQFGLAAKRVGPAHRFTTAPLDSRFSV